MQRPRLLAAAFIVWLLTGFYVVRVDEQAVVRRFGGVIADLVGPGLHLGFPWLIDSVHRVKVREQKRLTVGFELPDQALGRPVNPLRREYFTGDQNLVNIELLVQFTVRDARAYLFATPDISAALRQACEGAVTATVAARPVDLLLTTGRLEIQQQLRDRTQQLADAYGLGVSISAVHIQAVDPPVNAADAFRDVAAAREDRDRLIKEAESYANAARPAAEGEAARMGQEALAYRSQKILTATGDAERFTRAYQAYRLSPDVTQARLYLDTVAEILPRMKIISIDRSGGGTPIDLHILPRTPGAPTNGQNGPNPPGSP